MRPKYKIFPLQAIWDPKRLVATVRLYLPVATVPYTVVHVNWIPTWSPTSAVITPGK